MHTKQRGPFVLFSYKQLVIKYTLLTTVYATRQLTVITLASWLSCATSSPVTHTSTQPSHPSRRSVK